MAKAKKLPSGSWSVRVPDYKETIDGKEKWRYKRFTANTKKEAEYMAAEYTLTNKRKKPATVTVCECVCGYIDGRSNVLSPVTIATYRRIYNRHFKDNDVPVKNLTAEYLQIEFNNLSKDLSPKTLRNIWGLLNSSIKHYYPAFAETVRLPEKNPKKIVIPTHADINMILQNAKGTDLYLPILLACSTGLRKGEILGLTCGDYNPQNQTLYIHSSIAYGENGVVIRKNPKTSHGTRYVIPPPKTREEIERAIYGQEPDTPLTAFVNPSWLQNKYSRFIRSIGMGEYTLHTLRHFYASVMLAENVPDKYAMARMGHATGHMLKNVYQHLMLEKDMEITQKLDDAFTKLLD